MKIVHAHWSLNIGGTENMMIDIMNQQVHDHEVWCLIINDQVDDSVKARLDSRVHIKCYHRKRGLKGYLKLIHFNCDLLCIAPDVIHTHGEAFPRVIWPHRYPIVLTRHSTLGDGANLSIPDAICFISEAVRKHSLRQGFDGLVVYNGIHAEKIRTKDQNSQASTPFRIVQVGRLCEIKGQHLLIEAAERLVQEGFRDFRIDFIGDGETRSSLSNMIAEKHMEKYITLMGRKDRDYIYNHLCDYDLFVQASLSEGFGLTLAEGIAAGLYVLSCDLEGPMEVIGNGKYGESFVTGDVDSLSEQIKRFLLGAVADKRTEAKVYLDKNFTIASTADKYISVYKSVMK